MNATLGNQAPVRNLRCAALDGLTHKLTHLEQQAADLRLQLEERDQDLAAARDANRELMARLNTTARHR